MPKKRLFLALAAVLLLQCAAHLTVLPVQAQQRREASPGGLSVSDRLFSPIAGRKFYEIAYELAGSSEVRLGTPYGATAEQYEQALILLNATANLDQAAYYALADMIKIASRYSDKDRSALVSTLLNNYVSESADLATAARAIRYLLDQLNSRQDREELLEVLLKVIGEKNKALDSELYTLLGLLAAETADTEAATSYFMQAYYNNRYNRLAFAKLVQLASDQISPAMYIERLRLALAENPLDIAAALAFAQYAQQLELYEIAMDAYQYCAALFGHLYPSQPLPADIYLPWVISSYNSERNQHISLQIVERLRQSGRFDLFAEAIAGKAALKIGDTQQADKIFQAIEEKIQRATSDERRATQLAWFYCFALADKDKAIDWANKAYSSDPNSTAAAAILAYSLVQDGQAQWAKTIIDHINYEQNPIAALALAQIQLQTGQKDSGIESLKSVIAGDPGSLEAEHAKEILARYGEKYVSPTDRNLILALLKNTFAQALVPAFITPGKIISAQLNVRGNKFTYGSDFSGTVAITNNSFQPLVISEHSMYAGNIRIDAEITGDLNKKMPNLVSVRIRPASPVKPGASIFVPVQLNTAELRQVLLNFPQATVDIEFTVYLDPVTAPDGGVVNKLEDIEPVRVVVKRPGINLTGKYLRNRLDTLTKSWQGPKIKSTQLFTGLLAEQQLMANREPLYKFMYADWMPALLKSALTHSLRDDDWVVRVHTMAGMLSLTLDYELTAAAAENLDDNRWPVRLMAVYLLAHSQGSNFSKALDWTAKYDSNQLVKAMAIALGGADPEAEKPPEGPSQDNSGIPAQPSDPNI